MKGVKNAKAQSTSPDTPNLAELLDDGPDGQRFDYDSVEWDALGRVITVACRLGAMVSVYRSTVDDTLNVSIRLGEQRRAYSAPDADAFSALCNGLAVKLSGALKSGFRQV